MKSRILLVGLMLSSMMAVSQTFNNQVQHPERGAKLLGKINQQALTSESYSTWFVKNKEAYTPNAQVIAALQDALADYTIEAYMGTWCGDSKREVPRFYKILETAGFNLDRLTMIAVDNSREAYKQSPGGEHEGKTIHRVPTFIIKKNGVEHNRIVETPVTTLEEDLLAILNNTYQPNHAVVQEASKLLTQYGTVTFAKKSKRIAKDLQPLAENMYQLNTYSNVLFYAGNIEQALAIGTLNTLLFPDQARAHRSLGTKLFAANKPDQALAALTTALALDPDDQKTQQSIQEITSGSK